MSEFNMNTLVALLNAAKGSNTTIGMESNIATGITVEEQGGGKATVSELYQGTIVLPVDLLGEPTEIEENAERTWQSSMFRTARAMVCSKSTLTGETVLIGNYPVSILDKSDPTTWNKCLLAIENKEDKVILDGSKLIKIRYPEKFAFIDKQKKPIINKSTGTIQGSDYDWIFIGPDGADWQTRVRTAIRRRRNYFISAVEGEPDPKKK